jgi:hemolysin activation/secretion protein
MLKAFILSVCICNIFAAQDKAPPLRDPKQKLRSPNKKKQNLSRTTTQKPRAEKKQNASKNDIVLKRLYGIIINGSCNQVPEYVTQREDSVAFYSCMDIISDKKQEAFKQQLQAGFIGRSLTLDRIQKIKDEIQKFYQKNGQSLVIVQVNEQDVTDGVLIVSVIEARRADLLIQGNKHFSDAFYTNQIQVERDQIIENGTLMQDIEWINRNPFRKVNCTLRSGKKHATTDIILNVSEVKPLHFFVGVDNTGFSITNYTRLFAGFNAGGFCDDHLVSMQYIASPDQRHFQGLMMQYTFSPIRRDLLTISAGYSRTHPKNTQCLPVPVLKGQSWQISPRYNFTDLIPKLWPNIAQDFEFGFDFKRTDNAFTVGELIYYNSLVTIFQFMGGYNINYDNPKLLIKGKAEVFASPFGIGCSMSQNSYNYLRADADSSYIYLRFASDFTYYLMKGIDLQAKLKGQVANGTLLPIEMYGIGGVNSVRGYTDRALNADNALLASFEIHAPPLTFLYKTKPYFKVKDTFRAHLFLDSAVGFQNTTVQYEKQAQTLVGLGLGFRYYIGNAVCARFDAGYPCNSLQRNNRTSQVYFSLTSNF